MSFMKKGVIPFNISSLKKKVIEYIEWSMRNELNLNFSATISQRFMETFVMEVIKRNIGKFILDSRKWGRIEPLVINEIINNRQFIGIDDNFHLDKIEYLFVKERRSLEDELLAEVVFQFPFLIINDDVSEQIRQVIECMSQVLIQEHLRAAEELTLLSHTFSDNFIEIYHSPFNRENILFMVGNSVPSIIDALAKKELELQASYYVGRAYA